MKIYNVIVLASILTMSSFSVLAKDILPDGWIKAGNSPADYTMGLDEDITFDGSKSAFIEGNIAKTEGFGTLMQTSSVEDYLGQRVQLTFNIKTQDVSGWSSAWFRIDGAPKEVLAFDNMNKRQIKETTKWTEYSIVLDVPKNATKMAYGVMLSGGGKVWFDNLSFDIVDKNTPVTDMYAPKGQKEAKNLSFENE
mgnify:CR=1 FL=1